MSGKLMGAVMRARLKATDKSVLMVYAYHIHDNRPFACPNLQTLIDMSGLEERAVQMAKKRLVEKGLLVPAGHLNRSPKYEINTTLLAALEQPENPALDAEDDETKPALDAEDTTKPALNAGDDQTKPALDAEDDQTKPALNAGDAAKPASNAPKPALDAPKKDSKRISLKQEEEEEKKEPAAPAAPAGKGRPVTEADAERIWRQVTSMITIPGGAEAALQVTKTILELADKHGEDTAQFLKPYWQAHSLSRTANGTQYSRTKTFWLDTWAVAEEIPEQQLAHIRSLPAEKVPPELKQWIASRGSNGKPVVAAGGKGLSAEELAAAGQAELQKLLNRRQQTTGGTNGK